MEIRYSCLCGARNRIPVAKRPPGGKPAFFYCQDCGKPSQDHCLRCGFNAPPGSGHRFCNGCGAGADSIQRGVETLDFRREATDLVLLLFFMPGVYYVLKVYFCPWYNAFIERHMAEYMRYSGYVFLAFISFFVLRILLSLLTGPAWGLLTGTEALPLFWREVALGAPRRRTGRGCTRVRAGAYGSVFGCAASEHPFDGDS